MSAPRTVLPGPLALSVAGAVAVWGSGSFVTGISMPDTALIAIGAVLIAVAL